MRTFRTALIARTIPACAPTTRVLAEFARTRCFVRPPSAARAPVEDSFAARRGESSVALTRRIPVGIIAALPGRRAAEPRGVAARHRRAAAGRSVARRLRFVAVANVPLKAHVASLIPGCARRRRASAARSKAGRIKATGQPARRGICADRSVRTVIR